MNSDNLQEPTSEEKTVSMDTLHMLVRRLANQRPTRYFLDGLGDFSFSHFAIEIWLHRTEENPCFLDEDLSLRGFAFRGTRKAGEFTVYRWIARRETT